MKKDEARRRLRALQQNDQQVLAEFARHDARKQLNGALAGTVRALRELDRSIEDGTLNAHLSQDEIDEIDQEVTQLAGRFDEHARAIRQQA